MILEAKDMPIDFTRYGTPDRVFELTMEVYPYLIERFLGVDFGKKSDDMTIVEITTTKDKKYFSPKIIKFSHTEVEKMSSEELGHKIHCNVKGCENTEHTKQKVESILDAPDDDLIQPTEEDEE